MRAVFVTSTDASILDPTPETLAMVLKALLGENNSYLELEPEIDMQASYLPNTAWPQNEGWELFNHPKYPPPHLSLDPLGVTLPLSKSYSYGEI